MTDDEFMKTYFMEPEENHPELVKVSQKKVSINDVLVNESVYLHSPTGKYFTVTYGYLGQTF